MILINIFYKCVNIYLLIKSRKIVPPYNNHLHQLLYQLVKRQQQGRGFQLTVLYTIHTNKN
jgi:hypothetical protein